MKDHVASEFARLLRQVSVIEPSLEESERAFLRTRKALSEGFVAATSVSEETLLGSDRRARWIAARIAAVLFVAIGGIGYLFLATPGAQVFAQVQSALTEVPSISFSVEVLKAPEDVVVTPGISVVDLVENRFRFQSADGAEISVIDGKHGISMRVFPRQQRAVIWRHRSLDHLPTFMGLLKSLRDCDATLAERMSDAELDGRAVERYRIPPESSLSGGVEMLVYVDPKTHLPVRIDSTTDTLGAPLHIVCKDFSFVPSDPSLFATVPPEGYLVDRVDSDAPLAPVELASPDVDLRVPPSLEFRLAEQAPGKGLVEAETPNIPDQKIFLHPEPIITREHIESCRLLPGQIIEITFTDAGSARLEGATSSVPTRLAVLVNGDVVVSILAQATISKKASIAGSPNLVRRFSESVKDGN
jgi:hypothetical protein